MDEDSIVWLVAGAVLALDLLFALVRASLVNARLPQMMNLAAQEDRPGSQRTLKLLERPSLRMTLRFSVVLTHFVLLAALLWQFTRAVAPLQSWQMLLAGAAAALLLPLLETTVEGIALRNPDSSLVSGTDPNELATVRDGYAAKKLGLSPEAADAGIARVLEQLKGVHRKSRVTFYYLLADVTGTLDKLA